MESSIDSVNRRSAVKDDLNAVFRNKADMRKTPLEDHAGHGAVFILKLEIRMSRRIALIPRDLPFHAQLTKHTVVIYQCACIFI